MSGILLGVFARSAGGGGGTSIVTVGSYSYYVPPPSDLYLYYYGYNISPSLPAGFGSISGNTFGGATITGIYSFAYDNTPPIGYANSYSVVFTGNRSAGFFNTLNIGGNAVSGTLGAPSYDSGADETTFTITVAQALSFFGSVDGINKTVIMT